MSKALTTALRKCLLAFEKGEGRDSVLKQKDHYATGCIVKRSSGTGILWYFEWFQELLQLEKDDFSSPHQKWDYGSC